ncbi:hypothetical protein LguiB_031969 [Lonicera macranthoides]
MDLLHTLHHKLLIEREGYSFEVNVTYENLTKFCMHCHIIGHLVGECNSLKKVQEEAIRYNQQQHSSHDPSTVNARKNKQHLVPILSTKPSVSASNPTTVARNNQKSQLQPITTATDSLADQNGVVTGVESKDSMPSNTVMALNEVFGAHSPPLITFSLLHTNWILLTMIPLLALPTLLSMLKPTTTTPLLLRNHLFLALSH